MLDIKKRNRMSLRPEWFNPIGQVLALTGLRSLSINSTYMLYPAGAPVGNRHYLLINGQWVDQCPLTGGSMAATGEITGGSQSVFTATTVEAFSIIWNNSGVPVVAFSIGFNRALTASERSALNSTAFWALILPAAIDTGDCSALYPWLAPKYQDLVLWPDASAITGLANNDPCDSWADKSGLGNHVVQTGVASLKPTYKTNQQNSLPALSFDGGDYLLADNVASYFTGNDPALSLCGVFKNTAGGYVVSFGKSDSVTPLLFIPSYNGTSIELFKRDDAATSLNRAALYGAGADAHILSIVSPGTVCTSWVNNTIKHNAVAWDAGATTLNKFSIGTWFRNGASSTPWTGVLSEILLYKSALSDADRQRIQSYLGTKWGIALS